MKTILKVLRYLVFGLFIICNATVASIAVWNFSLAQTFGWNSQIDIYLIFLGCFGLAVIFSIIFVELAYRHAVTGRVWFECTWVGIFWLLYLAGAAAVTAIAPSRLCKTQSSFSLNDACVSTRVLVAFTWIVTIILLLYFCLLVISSLFHLKHDSRIWHCYVHKFPWGECQRTLSSAPASPSIPRFLKKMPSIVAPKPQRPAPFNIYGHHGLGSEYEIESYATPIPTMNRPPPSLPPAVPPFPHPYNAPQAADNARPSFYPQYMQPALTSQSQQQTQIHRLPEPPSPPVLGNWPRPNAVMQFPPRSKRKKPTMVLPAIDTQVPPITPPTVAALNNASLPRPRPSGPRRRSDGESRPAVAGPVQHQFG